MVKNATQVAKKLTSLVKTLKKTSGEHPVVGELPPTELLVKSVLRENATSKQVDDALDALMEELVDFNELRVTAVHEFVELVGEAYPQAAAKAESLTRILNAVFNDEHGVEMQKLSELGKRDAKKYLEALDGMNSFVASSMLLLHLEARAMPVDQLLLDYLVNESVLTEGEVADLAKLESFITSNVKAPDLLATYYALRHGVDSSTKTTKKKSSKKSTKKTTKKAAKKTAKKAAKKVTKKAAKKTAKKAAKKTTKKKSTRKKA